MKTKQSLQANKTLLIKKTFSKSPKSLQNLSKTAFINSNGFRARFWDHVRTMPSVVKLDVMCALFDGARTILENDALDEWPPVMSEKVLEALLFGDRGGHNFTGQDDAVFVDVVRKLRCDGCGRQNGGSVVNGLPAHINECDECGNYIEHARLDNDDLRDIIYNFDNWCQGCCVQPLFNIHYLENYNQCVRCAMVEAGYNSNFADKLCEKYHLAPLHAKYGIQYINKLIDNKIVKM
ncbi:hypothetical protein [Dasychira pudibunda nucleopolyhedrovirus]|nr:hypothetical protein [Dasychira pudibunda nucleopolyhedrovirus]WHM28340.1 hypothetical protein [Dasychira pudibunda nucleopolyhedrovirus]